MAAASRTDIERWFDEGVAQGATHMLVVCDTYDHSDYPVYVEEGEDVREKAQQFNGVNMQTIMECYDLSLSKAEQMAEPRAWHPDVR